jgi:hypothetical protein
MTSPDRRGSVQGYRAGVIIVTLAQREIIWSTRWSSVMSSANDEGSTSVRSPPGVGPVSLRFRSAPLSS